jgi:hypothetical protein
VADPRLEVGGDRDIRAPIASDRRKKKREGETVGPAGSAGWAAWGGLRARARARVKGRRPNSPRRLRKRERERWAGWSERVKGRGERGFGFFYSLNSFQIHSSNFETSLK